MKTNKSRSNELSNAENIDIVKINKKILIFSLENERFGLVFRDNRGL
jgi:hypothetical protein